MTSGLPFDDTRNLVRQLSGPDDAARASVCRRNADLALRRGTLGRLDGIAEWLAAWTGRPPRVARPVVALFAGTHGIAAHGLSSRPGASTAELVELCASGGAAVSQICGAEDIGLKVFDLALDLPTGDIAAEPAMDERICAATMAFGMEAVAGGADLICIGALGIGGSTVATAMLAALLGTRPADLLDDGGPGEGAAARRIALLDKALALHAGHLGDPLEVLRRLGGREFAAMAGAILAARVERVPVILDGFAATAAAAVLQRLDPGAIAHCMLSHRAPGRAHALAIAALGLKPLLDLDLTHGEGVGGALAVGVVKSAAAIHAGMAG